MSPVKDLNKFSQWFFPFFEWRLFSIPVAFFLLIFNVKYVQHICKCGLYKKYMQKVKNNRSKLQTQTYFFWTNHNYYVSIGDLIRNRGKNPQHILQSSAMCISVWRKPRKKKSKKIYALFKWFDGQKDTSNVLAGFFQFDKYPTFRIIWKQSSEETYVCSNNSTWFSLERHFKRQIECVCVLE